MDKIDWPSLKASGYSVYKSAMWGREGDMWFPNGPNNWSGIRVKTKGEAMRLCREHAYASVRKVMTTEVWNLNNSDCPVVVSREKE